MHIVDPEGEPDERMGFTACVRCRQCDSSGPWRIGADGVLRVTAYLLEHAVQTVVLGRLVTFDGQEYRYGGEAEDHLKDLLAKEPERAFLWSRLGNLYRSCRDKRARDAYETALRLDPNDAEIWYNLAELDREASRLKPAANCYRQMLRHARTTRSLYPAMVRELVRSAIDFLLDCGESLFVEESGPEFVTSLLIEPRDRERLVGLFCPDPGEPVRREPKPGRNEPCPCGSGAKFKKCCLAVAV